MNEEMVWFEFPRELVEQADVVESRVYWERLVEGENAPAASRLTYLTYIQILDWQEANRYRVTPETRNGTEVKIVNLEREYLEEPILFVGVDPTEPDGFAVVVTGDELLRFVAWDKLRLVEPLTGGNNNE